MRSPFSGRFIPRTALAIVLALVLGLLPAVSFSAPTAGTPATLSASDLYTLQNSRLEPFAAPDGTYHLRVVDATTGAPVDPASVSDPRLQAQFGRIAARSYASSVDAQNSARSYRGWLTRQSRTAVAAAPAETAPAGGTSDANAGSTPAANAQSKGDMMKSLRNQSIQSIPVMLGAGFAESLITQAVHDPKHIDVKSAWKSVANWTTVKAIGGAIAGGGAAGLLGIAAAPFLGPLALPVMLAADVGGATLGANLATHTKTDWKRFAFDTAVQTAVAFPLFFANPVVGFVGMAVAARAADKLYDKLFVHKKKNSDNSGGTPDGPADSKGKPPRVTQPPLEQVEPPPTLLGVQSVAVR